MDKQLGYASNEIVNMRLILGPSSAAVEAIRQIRLAGELNRVTVLVAWARIAGVAYFFDALGQDVGKVRVIVGMAGAGTSAEALSYLRGHCREVYLFHKHHRQTYHPKVYCFDEPGNPPVRSRLLVGSSNLTGGGLFSNFEGSLVATLLPATSADDLATWKSVIAGYSALSTSPYAERILDDDRIQVLLDERYLSTEIALRRRSGRDAERAAKGGRRRAKPEAPPPPMILPPLPPAVREFVGRAVERVAAPIVAPSAAPPLPFTADGRFFARTLTANDVAKVLNVQTGTFEPDLGVTARDEMPEFWGWPDKFERVMHKTTPREEWRASAVVFSSTHAEGVEVELMIWFRAARFATTESPRAHAAEFRLRPSIGDFRQAVPPNFSVTSIVIFERLPEREAYDFRIRIVTEGEPEFNDFRRYLRTARPGHHYGYGPDDPDE